MLEVWDEQKLKETFFREIKATSAKSERPFEVFLTLELSLDSENSLQTVF